MEVSLVEGVGGSGLEPGTFQISEISLLFVCFLIISYKSFEISLLFVSFSKLISLCVWVDRQRDKEKELRGKERGRDRARKNEGERQKDRVRGKERGRERD